MDILEKIFAACSNWSKRKIKQKKDLYKVSFEDEALSITSLCILSSSCPEVSIKQSKGMGFITKEAIYFPEAIDFFENKKLNREAFLHKALVAGIIHKHDLKYSSKFLNTEQRTAQILESRVFITNKLEQILPNYKNYFEDFIFASQEMSWAPWCELMVPVHESLPETDALSFSTKEAEKNIGTEVDGSYAPEVEVISLEKEREKENPVAHSFEKLETADEYRGGYKMTDSSDQIMEHSAALDELKLSKITRDGGSAGSTYKTAANSFFNTVVIKSQQPRYSDFLYYPEWNYKSKKLVKDFCRLYVGSEFGKDDCATEQSRFYTMLKEKYHTEIKFWETKIENILNQNRIVRRQWDGADVDIDAFVRYVSDKSVCGDGDPRLYLNSRKLDREFACLVLLDQSLSTDSWVLNKRILDLELESVGLMGHLLKEAGDEVLVAGTWSETRNHCHFKTYKKFNEPWTAFFDHAENIVPQGYTRLGPSIRHSEKLLNERKANKKLLILLTDGKPTDFDSYEGVHGIEDVRYAINACQKNGIAVKALAIDSTAKSYFPVLFGKNDYQILSNPATLPEILFKLYMQALNH